MTYKIFLFISPGGTIFQYMESENEAVKPRKKKYKGETKLNHTSSDFLTIFSYSLFAKFLNRRIKSPALPNKCHVG